MQLIVWSSFRSENYSIYWCELFFLFFSLLNRPESLIPDGRNHNYFEFTRGLFVIIISRDGYIITFARSRCLS